MLFPIKNREGLEKIGELASLQSQVEEAQLQDKLSKQKFHVKIKKKFEPVNDTIENTSENLTKTLTGNSLKNNQALESLKIKTFGFFKW